LKPAIDNPLDLDFRAQTMLGSLYAGLAFSNASLGAVHAMAHSIGGLLDKPHGECNSILLEHVVDFNFYAATDRYRAVGEAMGLDFCGIPENDIKKRLIDRIRDMRISVGIDRSLKTIGLEKSSIPILAGYALQDACMATNPVIPDQNDIEVIYEKAY
jgi:alcohol dehydrogenase class IV